MKNVLFSLTALALSCSLAFTFAAPDVIIPTGTYGVCGCNADASGAVELKLNADHTYSYKNTSDSNHPVEVQGSWNAKGGSIQLSGIPANQPVPSKWKLDKNGKCLKGRTGMMFLRLCHTEMCE